MNQSIRKRICKYEGCFQAALEDGTKGIPLCKQHVDELADIVQNWEIVGPAKVISFWLKTNPFPELS